MSNPEIQEIVVDIVKTSLKLLAIKDKQVKEFLETIIELEIAELNELEVLNEAYWGNGAF